MAPANRYFTNLQSTSSGKEQDFRIEPESESGLLLKYVARPLQIEQLEAALRVLDVQSQQQANRPIKENSTDLTKSRLMLLDETAVHGPRTDHDGGVLADSDVEEFG